MNDKHDPRFGQFDTRSTLGKMVGSFRILKSVKPHARLVRNSYPTIEGVRTLVRA